MEERAKRPGTLAHCLSFAGARRGLVVASLLLAALSAAASFVPFVAIYFVIADVVAAYPDLAALDAGALAGCGLLAIAGVAADVGLYLAALLCSHAAAFDTQYRLKLGIAEHLGRIPLGHIARLGSGRLSKIMDEGVSGIETFIAHSLPDLASTAAAPAVLLVLLFVFDWRFGLAAIAAVVVAMAAQFAGYANKRIMQTMGRYQEAKERMGNAAVEYVRGMAVVKAYGRTASSFARLADAVKDCTGLSLDVTLFFQNSLPAFTAILNNAYLFILPVGILLAPGASDWPAFALSFIFYLLFVPSVAAVFNKILYVSEDMMIAQSNIDRVDAVLDVPALPVPDAPDREQPRDSGIEFDHVSFSYRTQKVDTGAAAGADAAEGGGAQGAPLALDDVSLRIPARTTCAIVGASGSGKSTIAHLIARFWDVDAGSVRIGGADVRRMAPDDLMAQMSLVFQDVHLFRESIAANIARGRAGATREEVEAAARAAQADGFIRALPQGYDTMIGAEGVHLSGGERQRISIARAIVADAPIVVLDEATAFSDPENEHLIQQALARLMRGKTVVMIAHRLSTVVGARQIIVMDGGRVAQQGTHEGLLAKEGPYRRMWRRYTQAVSWQIGNEGADAAPAVGATPKEARQHG